MVASNLERAFRLVLYDALASEAMGTLTTGVFLAGFMVQLGASNLAIGLLAAVPFSVQFLQLPAVVLVERIRARRAICAWAAAIGRSVYVWWPPPMVTTRLLTSSLTVVRMTS